MVSSFLLGLTNRQIRDKRSRLGSLSLCFVSGFVEHESLLPIILEAAERFMVRWYEGEAELSRQRRVSAVGGAQGNGGEGEQQEEWQKTRPREIQCGEGGGRRSRRETAVDKNRKEMADRVVRHKAD